MIQYTENASLLSHNTFGMNVKARLLVEYTKEQDLDKIFADARVKDLPFLCIGQGSNLLFTSDFDGVILHGQIKGIRPQAQYEDVMLVEAGAGETFDDVCAWAVAHQLYGAENLSAIPGEVGAAAVQNIGAYGVEFKDLCVAVSAYDIENHRHVIIGADQCQYGYRTSIFKQPEMKQRFVITGALLQLRRASKHHQPEFNLEYGNMRTALAGKPLTLESVRNAVCDIRAAKLPDPKQLGNAGSFFKNPIISRKQYDALRRKWSSMPCYEVDTEFVKVPAGWLIEQAGLKGYQLGGAAVYEKQCLVLVNKQQASPADLVALCQHVVKTVSEKYGINIEPEVNII
ncbi:MAG: UDP-N-acetylmuramate dehydrogenase [Bacteroidales bacterium]|nr:UDP-N-acetylmuramate dehydrogenase [Bacteroidales bacterium]